MIDLKACRRAYSKANSAERIRLFYQIPHARAGNPAIFQGKPGTITKVGGRGGMYVWFRADGETTSVCCHPTWQMTYLPRTS